MNYVTRVVLVLLVLVGMAFAAVPASADPGEQGRARPDPLNVSWE